jgi:hypothetical protein
MEVVLNNPFIYQYIFIEWWWEEHHNFENDEESRRKYDEDHLGIEYDSESWYCKNWGNKKRKVINEHKFFLAKIKHNL